MKIVNSTICPVGSAAGHDADECRANLIDDGSVLCVCCGTRYPKLSNKMRSIFRAIAASGFATPNVEIGSSTQPGSSEYTAGCLSGHDPSQSDRVHATFTVGEDSCVLTYNQSSEHEVDNPDSSLASASAQSAVDAANLSARVKACVLALQLEGFTLRHYSNESGHRLVLTSGRTVGSMGGVVGASVTLSSGN